VTRRSDEELRRMIALGPRAVSTNVLGYDLCRELLLLRRLEALLREPGLSDAEIGGRLATVMADLDELGANRDNLHTSA
jgi:hypothetical protein